MAISQALCTSFKVGLMTGTHNFTNGVGGNTFKLALYTSAAVLSASTTAYTAVGEISSAPATNYTAGGNSLVNITPTSSGTTAYLDFDNLTFSGLTVAATRGCLIYNSTAAGNPSVCVLDFGSDKSATAGNFTIVFPTADASNAIIRIV